MESRSNFKQVSKFENLSYGQSKAPRFDNSGIFIVIKKLLLLDQVNIERSTVCKKLVIMFFLKTKEGQKQNLIKTEDNQCLIKYSEKKLKHLDLVIIKCLRNLVNMMEIFMHNLGSQKEVKMDGIFRQIDWAKNDTQY